MKSLFVLIAFFAVNASAQVSAVREPNQSYLEIPARHLNLSTKKVFEDESEGPTAFSQRTRSVEVGEVAPWTKGDIHQAFKLIRDERFMTDKSGFARRPTWLYPKDGCFARAEIAAQRLVSKGFPHPSKIFIFGDLVVQTDNMMGGEVSWWYHVAVAYSYQNQIYIFDPSIEPNKLLTLKEWSDTMGIGTKEYSVCGEATFDPYWSCNGSKRLTFVEALVQQGIYFQPEERNLEYLGRNPKEELGDQAPWMRW